jgi:8-oxo-dGTP pyrophosphatase MutT (NUDIX family)
MTGRALLRAVLTSLYRLRGYYWWLARPFSLGVKALVLDQEGRVLLVKHTYQPGWHLPGGRVEKGESALAGAQRELREETGLDCTDRPWRMQGLYANFSEYKNDHVALFVAEGVKLQPLKFPWFEIETGGFFAQDALPKDTTLATLRRIRELHEGVSPGPNW